MGKIMPNRNTLYVELSAQRQPEMCVYEHEDDPIKKRVAIPKGPRFGRTLPVKKNPQKKPK